jgi:hypothetical protein
MLEVTQHLTSFLLTLDSGQSRKVEHRAIDHHNAKEILAGQKRYIGGGCCSWKRFFFVRTRITAKSRAWSW